MTNKQLVEKEVQLIKEYNRINRKISYLEDEIETSFFRKNQIIREIQDVQDKWEPGGQSRQKGVPGEKGNKDHGNKQGKNTKRD